MRIVKEVIKIKRSLPILNTIAYVAMVGVNIISQVIQPTTAEISDAFPTLLTPSGLTFSIWAIIYFLLLFYTIGQLMSNEEDGLGPLYLLSSILNICWIITWHYKLLFVSLLIIMMLAVVLFMINKKLKNAKSFIKTTFSIYYAWITIASIVSIFTWISNINGNVFDSNVLRVASVVTLILLSVLIYMYRDNVPYILVFIWALFGIVNKHTVVFNEKYIEIIITGIMMTILCVVVLIVYVLNNRKEKE